jgi:phosphoribosylpyrophosphate synthetase
MNLIKSILIDLILNILTPEKSESSFLSIDKIRHIFTKLRNDRNSIYFDNVFQDFLKYNKQVIFLDEDKNIKDDILYLGYYHPYHGGDNPNWDNFSSSILDVKKNRPHIIKYFIDEINILLTNQVFSICCVPSHEANQDKSSGILNIALGLVDICNNRIDATWCLQRVQTIQKLAHGGNRDLSTHLNSIEVVNNIFIKNQSILLIDDVTTSGNSLRACKQLLINSGAKEVKMLSLAKTFK